jgi:glutathione synthase/RimK-type ligase-like ATP-grasp enzyme
MEYHFKRYIIDYTDQYNMDNPNNRILVQNSEAIKKLPYYNKIALALFCSINHIPHFNTYFRTDGNYCAPRDMLNTYPLIMKEYSGANRVENINGEKKIKKNVFKIDNQDGYDQEYLRDLDHSRFFIQEFSDTKKDIRIFVKLGKIIAGWQREATDGFMTVNKGKYTVYNTPEPGVREISENVAQLLDADFLSVDIMYMNGKPLLQEISYHPGFKAYETKTGDNPVNIAEAIITAFKN